MNAAQMNSIKAQDNIRQCTAHLAASNEAQAMDATPEQAKTACEATYQDPAQRGDRFVSGENAQGMLKAIVADDNRSQQAPRPQAPQSEGSAASVSEILHSIRQFFGV